MTNRKRREFIVDGAKMTGAAICAAAIGHGLLSPSGSQAAAIKFPESICGVENKKKHAVLIAFASKCGSTGEVAEAIGDVLCQRGAIVETKWVN